MPDGSVPPPRATVDVVAAGHICVDLMPSLRADQSRPDQLWIPGRLSRIGPATVSLGGSVANTGLALHRLGASIRLVGKVGDDPIGKLLLEILREQGTSLGEDAIVASGEATSYTIVFSPPGVDRAFLHYSGTNDTFTAEELILSRLAPCRVLHFGYPPLMRGILADGGIGLATTFRAIQETGAVVSLDMAFPDAQSNLAPPAWWAWLRTVLPYVDLFAPSLDEMLCMLDPARHAALVAAGGGNAARGLDGGTLPRLAEELLAAGAKIVILKLGDQGLYLRSKSSLGDLPQRAHWSHYAWESWRDRELVAPCFRVTVEGTTGAGDCTIAGLLMGLLRGLPCESALRHAEAVGAWSVQSAAATANIPTWRVVQECLENPWPIQQPAWKMDGWKLDDSTQLFRGPQDRFS